MEKIKQALERAEQNRLRQQAVADGVISAVPGSGAADPAQTSSPGPADGIVLDRTRNVPVDETHLEKNRIRLPRADDEVARAYDLLASRVVEKVRSTGWNSIAVVSPVAGDGKSVTALNLAMRLVGSPKRTTLLVDLDFRRPKVAEYLGLTPQFGIEDVLHGRASVAETLICPGVPRLSVMPVREPIAHPGGLIDSTACSQLATEVKERYANRIVLFDLPPLLGHGDAMHFLQNVDAVLIVATAGKTTEASLQETVNTLAGHNIVGCVLNCASDIIAAY